LEHGTDHKDNLNDVIKELMKENEKDINEILDMPFSFLLNELYESSNKKKVKKSASMLDAFGGFGG
jgi:uncharacterized protein YceK